MEEINVVRKGSRIWLWVVGLIVLAAIVWAIVAMSGDHNPNPASQLGPEPGDRQQPVATERLAQL